MNGVIAPERRRLRVAVRRLHPSRVLASLLCWGPPVLAKPDILQMILFARSNIFTCGNYEMVVTNADRFFGGLALGLSLCPVQHRKSFLDLIHGSNARGTTVNPNPVCSSHKWNRKLTHHIVLTIESRPPSKVRQQIDCCLICLLALAAPFQFVFQILSVGFNACHISSAQSSDCRNKKSDRA